ncbi:MAG: hypothetical protein WC764_02315 [Candidatus Paceibacterota bacterium]|jgi:hypothetical protein
MDSNFDAELAALTQAVASERPASDAKEQLHAALTEKISELLPRSAPSATTDDTTQVPAPSTSSGQAAVKKAQAGSKSYLDTVDDATVAKVNGYVAQAFHNGIQATLRQVIEEDPFLLDVFHDALTDKLYSEMKSRGLVK